MTEGDQWARPTPDAHEIEVFATGTTVARAPDEPAFDDLTGQGLTELLRRSGCTVRDGYEHARDFHARPGHRPGTTPIATTSERRGSGVDIVRPVLVNPLLASDAAVSGRLFAELIPGLELEERDPDGARYLVWHARLSGRRVHSVPVSLHLLASPSMVVTVLELVPRHRLRRHRDASSATASP